MIAIEVQFLSVFLNVTMAYLKALTVKHLLLQTIANKKTATQLFACADFNRGFIYTHFRYTKFIINQLRALKAETPLRISGTVSFEGVKFHPRRVCIIPEGNYRYSSTLSLTSTLGVGG
jgi:hypothetical protein